MTKNLNLCLLLSLMFLLISPHINPIEKLNNENLSSLNFHFEKKVNINPNLTDKVFIHQKNPTRKEIFSYMCEIGKQYNIPPEILYAVAYAESGFKQFNKDGTPFITFDNGVGIMQITPGKSPIKFDIERAKYDYKYNIKIGAKILLEKWKEQYSIKKLYGETGYLLPTFKNNNPMILENWYFVLWAYNGYAGENNPNKLPMFINKLEGFKMKAYQDRVIDLADKDLRIKITKFPKELLPKDKNLPPVNTVYHTPEPFHYSILSNEYLSVNIKNNYTKLFEKSKGLFSFYKM